MCHVPKLGGKEDNFEILTQLIERLDEQSRKIERLNEKCAKMLFRNNTNDDSALVECVEKETIAFEL
jgi:hypothetical protein